MEDEVKLVETFHKMRQSSSFFPTIVDYNTMLNFYASRCLESTDVTAFSREAVENGGPNDIEEDNESGDSRTISMKERERCLTKIRFYFDDAATNNVFYNMHSCHIILRGLGSLGDFNQMYAYLMEMETAGFVIDIRTVNTMLGALAVSNSYSNTEELRKCFEFGRRNFSLNGTSYRVMLHHFANKLDVDSCKSIVALAAKDDIPLDVGAKMELLKLYVRLAGRRYLQEERTFPDNLASEIKAVVASIPLHASTVSRRKLYRLVDILASRMTFSDAVYILQQIYTLPTTLAPSSQNDNAGNNKPTQDHLAASTPAVWSMLSVVTQAKRSVAILTEKEYNDIFSFKLSTESESVGVEVSSAAGQRDENASEDDLAIPLSLGWLMQLSASLSSLETEITGGLRTHTRTHTVLPSSTDGAADSSNVRTAENESNWSSKQVITTGSLLKLFALREKMYLVNMRIEKLAQ